MTASEFIEPRQIEENIYKNTKLSAEEMNKLWHGFQWGEFSWCPSPECQIALAKELYEEYGARIMFTGLDRLTYYLEKPLLKKYETETAAKTLIIADGDLYPNYEETVEAILGRHIWQLWWD